MCEQTCLTTINLQRWLDVHTFSHHTQISQNLGVNSLDEMLHNQAYLLHTFVTESLLNKIRSPVSKKLCQD